MTLKTRVDRLEQGRAAREEREAPPYIAVGSLQDLDGLELARPVKVYLGGISPDDWDLDNEPDRE